MRSLLVIAFLFVTTIGLHAQNYQFYFGGNHHFSSTQKYTRPLFTSRSYQLLPDSDSLYLRTVREISSSYENKYTTIPGFLLGMNVDWDLGNKLSLRSGIGLSTVSFKLESRSLGTEVVQVGVPDTVTLSALFGGGPSLNPCTFINSSADLAEPDRIPRYSLLTLQIPLKLNYQLNDRLGVVFGGILRTPLASNRKRESINLEITFDDDGDRLCTYVFEKESDRSGRDFSDLTFQAELEVYCWLGNIGLSIGAGKMFTNLFVNEKNSRNLEARPAIGQFKVLYRFGEMGGGRY